MTDTDRIPTFTVTAQASGSKSLSDAHVTEGVFDWEMLLGHRLLWLKLTDDTTVYHTLGDGQEISITRDEADDSPYEEADHAV